MALTDEEKQKIIEEEQLRKSIRAESIASKANKFLGNILTLFILFGLVVVGLAFFLGAFN